MLDALESDKQSIQNPYYHPFTSLEDVVDRLLPFHVNQYRPQSIPTSTISEQELLDETKNLFSRYDLWMAKEEEVFYIHLGSSGYHG